MDEENGRVDEEVSLFIYIREGRGFSEKDMGTLNIRFRGQEWNKKSTGGIRPQWDLKLDATPTSTELFLCRARENHILVEVSGFADESRGVAFLPLHSVFTAHESDKNRFSDDYYLYPVIVIDDWVLIKDILSGGDHLGELSVQLVAGSPKQLRNFKKFYESKNEEEELSPQASSRCSGQSFSRYVSSLPRDIEETYSDVSFRYIDVNVIEARHLPSLSDRPEINPSAYVSFLEKYVSDIHHKTRSPMWNFVVKGVKISPDTRYLIVRLWHSNGKKCEEDEALGFSAIDLYSSLIEGWHNVMDLSGRLKGQLRVRIDLKESIKMRDGQELNRRVTPDAAKGMFWVNLETLEKMTSNIKTRLVLKNNLNKMSSLDFESIKNVDGEVNDLTDIDWGRTLENGASEAEEESRKAPDGGNSQRSEKT